MILDKLDRLEAKIVYLLKEVAVLRKETERYKDYQFINPARRREWSEFELNLIRDDLTQIITRRSHEFGRSTNSITWKLWHELDKRKE